VLAGNTTDEHLGWIAAAYPKVTAQTYAQLLHRSFGAKAAEIARVYPPAKYSSTLAALGRVYTDSNWICPTAEANLSYAKTGPTWTYLFGDPQAPTLDGSIVPRPAAPHGSDVAYTFPDPGIPLTDAQRRTGDRFIQAWTTFAHTGSPRVDASQSWPALPDHAYQFGPKDTLVNLNTDRHCTLW
jgi:para-nitrobenzyl esterase